MTTLASALCTVNGNSTIDGVIVPGGSPVIIQLADLSGVNSWVINCYATDNYNDKASINGSLSINPTTKTATFIAPNLTEGSTMLFESIINGQIDPINGGAKIEAWRQTFGIAVLSVGGRRNIAVGEATEFSAEFGWIPGLNDIIQNASIPATLAGAGLYLSGGAVNVGNSDGSIAVGTDEISVGLITDTQHGNQTNPILHAVATGASNGFMSSTDKAKLDASTSAATANTLVQRGAFGEANFTSVFAVTGAALIQATNLAGVDSVISNKLLAGTLPGSPASNNGIGTSNFASSGEVKVGTNLIYTDALGLVGDDIETTFPAKNSDSATQAFRVKTQAPYPLAVLNKKSGDFVIDVLAGGTTAETDQGALIVARAGTNLLEIKNNGLDQSLIRSKNGLTVQSENKTANATNSSQLTISSGSVGTNSTSGQITVKSGSATSSGGTSGAILLQSDNATSASGTLSIFSGTASAGNTGSLQIYSGSATNSLTSTVTSGAVSFSTGASTSSGSGTANSGALTFSTGNSTTGGASGSSGGIQFTTGTAITTGSYTINTGASTTGPSGAFTVNTGASSLSASGLITLQTGTTSAGSQNSGTINLTTGASSGSSAITGTINLTTGAVSGGSGAISGGISLITGGASTSATLTGAISIKTGTVTSAGGTSGNILIQSGNSGSGTSGNVIVDTGTATNKGGLSLLSTSPSFGGGKNVIFIADCTVAPTTLPAGGVVLYSLNTAGNSVARIKDSLGDRAI